MSRATEYARRAAHPYARRVDSLVDIGPGIRPQQLVSAQSLLCVEPHGAYAEYLVQRNYRVLQADALRALGFISSVDTITALDVIEHMTRVEGEEFVRRALEVASQQVIVFTPLGYLPQPPVDAWRMGGGEWQEHRSGWTPADFPGWRIVKLPGFHPGGHGAFFAIWNAA
jgi:hypothetical protein